VLANPALTALDHDSLDRGPRTRYVRGGYLEQPNYTFVLELDDPAVQRTGPLTSAQARDLLLAWAIGSTSNSNTVTLVRDGQLLGNGVGQQDRVGGCALAITRATDAGHATEGSVAYSDSFFPFPDGAQLLVDAGVTAVFCTTGSVRDDVVRQAFTDAGVTVVQLPDRLARGFFGH
jgi:phosphoribosylaminoimidazolecarboxamide formyltransferase / IMP cyclohydrolase